MTIFNNLIENTTGLPQGVLLSDECLASIAISLKRIADTMGDGVRPAAEVPPTIPWNVTAQREFMNHLRSLYNIDADQLPELGDAQWVRFRDDPPRFLIHADDSLAAAIWREVEKRQVSR